MDDFGWIDATDLAALVRAGDVTPLELVDAAIARIEGCNPSLNAVVTPMFEQARDAAAQQTLTGTFAGVPYLLKDLAVEYAGVRFTEGSRFLRDNVSAHDQELTVRLRAVGLIVLGKTNTCEFGLAPTCEPVLFGPTRNPWDPSLTPSGSSGGSAAAVAAGMVPMAHANDLGGSIRYPASACGLFGLKPARARNRLGPEYGDVVCGMAVEAVTRSAATRGAARCDVGAGPRRSVRRAAGATVRGRSRRPRSPAHGAHPPQTQDLPVHADCVAAIDDAMLLCEALGHEVVEAD